MDKVTVADFMPVVEPLIKGAYTVLPIVLITGLVLGTIIIFIKRR